MKNRTWINMICTVLVLATFVYLFHDAVRNNRDRYDTETADEVVEQEKLELKAFLVRDEEYINQKTTGTVVPLIKDGMRVASGDAVARVCASRMRRMFQLCLKRKKVLQDTRKSPNRPSLTLWIWKSSIRPLMQASPSL